MLQTGDQSSLKVQVASLGDKPGFLSLRLDVRRQTLSLRVCSHTCSHTRSEADKGLIFKSENDAHVICQQRPRKNFAQECLAQ